MTNILNIKTEPDPDLRNSSSPVTNNNITSAEMKEFYQDMVETMKTKDGIGLAAPQVGENIRVIAIKENNDSLILINPKITKRSFAKEWGEEGCLSVPGTFGQVRRHKKVNCLYLDEQGKKRKMRTSDLTARILQHEIDHLDGILFTDKAENIRKEQSREQDKETI